MKQYDSYKDSGVQWIGKITSHWDIGPLKYYTNVIMGQSPDGDDIKDDGIILFMQGNAEFGIKTPSPIKYCDTCKKHSRIGDILLSVRAPVGATNISDKIYGIGRGLCSIKAINISNGFLWYYIKIAVNGFKMLSTGSTFEAISMEDLNSTCIIIPTIDEQKKISEYLDKKCEDINRAIATQQKRLEMLGELRQHIITHAVTRGINPKVSLKDSGVEWIGKVPEHWEVKRIKHVISLLTDYDANGSFADIAKNCNVNMGEPYAWMVRATDLENKRYGIVDGNNYCDLATYKYLSKSSLKEDDILIAKRGDIGKSYLVPACEDPMTLAPNTYLLLTNKDVINNRYFYNYLQSKGGVENLRILNKSTTLGALYKDDVKAMQIPVPPLSEQQQIVAHIEEQTARIDKSITKAERQISLLQELKQSIITEVVTGKRKVIE